jgi:hypothetical protein
MSHPFLEQESIFRAKKRYRPALTIITKKPMPQLPRELWSKILLINRRRIFKERIAEMETKIYPMREFRCDCGRHFKYNKWGDPHGWGIARPVLATPRFFHEFVGGPRSSNGQDCMVDVWSFWKYQMCKSIDVHVYEYAEF